MGESTAVAVIEGGGQLVAETFSEAQVQVIRNLFAKGATNDELAVFLRLAAKYDLDPLAREIWCICELDNKGERKTDNRGDVKPPQIQASRAGWRKVAQRDERCAGIEAGAVYSKDTFTRQLDGSVDHQPCLDTTGEGDNIKADRGKLLGAYALVWRHDWARPAYAWASWAEYGAKQVRGDDGKIKTWSPWAKYPSAMIEKQAESMALRQAFPLGALAAGDDRAVEHEVVDVPRPAPADTGEAQQPDPSAGSAEPGGDDPHLFPPPDDQLAAEAEAAQNFEDIG